MNDVKFVDCEFLGFPDVGLLLDGAINCEVRSCDFRATSAIGSRIFEGIWIRSTNTSSTQNKVHSNTFVNCGMNVDTSFSSIIDNDISDFAYGSGITTEASADSHNLTIMGNRAYNSTGPDMNGVTPAGIENWAADSTIIGNKCYKG